MKTERTGGQVPWKTWTTRSHPTWSESSCEFALPVHFVQRSEVASITPAVSCGPRRVRDLRVPVRSSVRPEVSKARDRPDRQLHRVVMLHHSTHGAVGA